jgi:hypothetical protein
MSVRRLALAAVAALLPSSARAASPAEECIAAADAGQTHRDASQLLRARADFTACAASRCPGPVRGDCTKWLTEVESALPTVVFIARYDDGSDARDVKVSMDGAALVSRLDGSATAVDPGEHTFTFSVGAKEIRQTILVHSGEHNRTIIVRLPSEQSTTPTTPATPAKSSFPVAAAIVGGIGIAVLGTGIVFGALAKSDLNKLEADPCAATRQCSSSDVSAIKTRYIVADVLMGTGVVALGIGVVLWLTHGGGDGSVRTGAIAF